MGEPLKNEVEDQLPNGAKWLEFRSYSYSDIPPVLYGEEKGNNTPKEWAEYRAKKLEENYCGTNKEDIGIEAESEGNTVYVLRNENQRIYHNILKGKIEGEKGLKVSENHFYGKKPKYAKKHGDYHLGLIIKITGDYDASMQSYHDKVGMISEIIDDYHYDVRLESSEVIQIRDTDVKSWICSKKTGDCFSQAAICSKMLYKASNPNHF